MLTATLRSLTCAVPEVSLTVLDHVPALTTTVPVAGAVPRRTFTRTVGRVPALAFLGALTAERILHAGAAAEAKR